MDVRIYNTNTRRIVVETVALDASGEYDETGDYTSPESALQAVKSSAHLLNRSEA
jgi:hypothetical protein